MFFFSMEQAVDMGGSMFVHTFGAYFGLAVDWILHRCLDVDDEHENEKSNTNSDIFSVIGKTRVHQNYPN